MVLEFELTPEQETKLRAMAAARGITVEELARLAIVDFIRTTRTFPGVSDEEVRKHMEASIRQNAELLRRLA